MKTTQTLILLLLALTLSACTLAKAPVGSIREKLNPQDWNGDWTNEDDEFGGDTIHIRVMDAEKGILQASRGTAPNSGTAEIYIRKLGGWDIASVRFDQINPDAPKADGAEYVFMRLQRVGKNILIAVPPKHDLVKRLVDQHNLNGVAIPNKDGKPSDDYLVDDIPESLVPLLKEASCGNPFDSDSITYVFKRRKDNPHAPSATESKPVEYEGAGFTFHLNGDKNRS